MRNARKFADDFLGTGIRRFIVQPFHFQRGKFVAGTRDAALSLMSRKLSSDPKAFREAYLEYYRGMREVLERRLPERGEGKDGFRPPF